MWGFLLLQLPLVIWVSLGCTWLLLVLFGLLLVAALSALAGAAILLRVARRLTPMRVS
jgi:hypothetical protein